MKVRDFVPRFTVRHYGSGQTQALHTDVYSRISLVLRGSVAENNRQGPMTLKPGDLLLKGHRVVHEDRYGAGGATIASLQLSPEQHPSIARSVVQRKGRQTFIEGLAMLEAGRAGCPTGLVAAAMSLLAEMDEFSEPKDTPPAWLKRLKQTLESKSLKEVDIAAQAEAAGVHPVHASRLFRRCYGVSITEHAQHHGVRRAFAKMTEPQLSLAEIALDAGFYDQSHMNRVFKRTVGRTPGAVRVLCGSGPGEPGKARR